MELITSLLAAVLLDQCLGEPRRFHPLVGFGNYAHLVERGLYAAGGRSARTQNLRGALATIIAVAPFAAAAVWLEWNIDGVVHWVVSTTALYFALGHASLRSHARAVSDTLARGDIGLSRQAVGHLVSRDTENLGAREISAATIESVLENGNDALFGALFWFIIAGIPGALIYRLVNTLDAMWGYKNVRYLHFGRVAAKLDDAINWLPARLTAASYAILGNTRAAIECWRSQSGIWKSPNAGAVMASGAGALLLCLGGEARYHGRSQQRPALGCGAVPDVFDIGRALALVLHTLLLWLVISGVFAMAIVSLKTSA
jgi:adenosylcobinamide-phosphate synthase